MQSKDVFDFDVREVAIDAVEKVFEGETTSGRPTIRVDAVSVAAIVVENERLRIQVKDLQERGTQMAMERQRWRDPSRMKAIADEWKGDGDPGIYVEAMRELVEAP